MQRIKIITLKLFCSICFILLAVTGSPVLLFSQQNSRKPDKVLAYVKEPGNAGQFTYEGFEKFDSLSLNSPGLKVSSFTAIFVGVKDLGPQVADVNGNSLKGSAFVHLLNMFKGHSFTIVFDRVSYLDQKGIYGLVSEVRSIEIK